MRPLRNPSTDELTQLSTWLSKLLKKRFGKGPEACHMSVQGERLLIYTRQYMTPVEDVLKKSGRLELAHQVRAVVIDKVYGEFVEAASDVMGVRLDRYYHDWDYERNAGILMLEGEGAAEENADREEAQLKSRLFKQMMQVGSLVHKPPRSMSLLRFGPNVIVVECLGVLLHIEHVLAQQGDPKLLHERSLEIKHCYLSHKDGFEQAIGREIEGLFKLWDFDRDRSYTFFYLH